VDTWRFLASAGGMILDSIETFRGALLWMDHVVGCQDACTGWRTGCLIRSSVTLKPVARLLPGRLHLRSRYVNFL